MVLFGRRRSLDILTNNRDKCFHIDVQDQKEEKN